jgi:hypothetical protein
MKNKGTRIAALFMAMLVMSMFAVAPAMACAPSAQAIDGSSIEDDFTIETEDGLGELSALLDIALDEDAREVINDLQSKGYKLQYKQMNVQKMYPKNTDEREATIAIIPAATEKSDKAGQVIFASNGDKTIVGNAIIDIREDYGKMEIYEINDGVENNYVVENKAGVMYVDGEPVLTEMQTDSGTDCDICMTVCDYVYTAGCGLTGFVTCTLGCACFSGPAAVACPPICAVVFAAICLYGSNNSCPILCQDYC